MRSQGDGRGVRPTRKLGGSFSREAFEIREMSLRNHRFHKVIIICVLTAWQLAACLTRPQATLTEVRTPRWSPSSSLLPTFSPTSNPTATFTPTATPTPTPVPLLGELEERTDATAYSLVATEYKAIYGIRVVPFETIVAPAETGTAKSYLPAESELRDGYRIVLVESQPYAVDNGSGHRRLFKRYDQTDAYLGTAFIDLTLLNDETQAVAFFQEDTGIDSFRAYDISPAEVSIRSADEVTGWLLTPHDNRDRTICILVARYGEAVIVVQVGRVNSQANAADVIVEASSYVSLVIDKIEDGRQ